MTEINIKAFDPEKKQVMRLLKIFNTFYRKHKKETVHDSLINSGNPIIKEIESILMDTLKNIADHKQGKDRYRERIQYPIEFFLNIYYKDLSLIHISEPTRPY